MPQSPLLTSLTATHVTATHVLALDFDHRLGEALGDVPLLSVGEDDFDQLDVDQGMERCPVFLERAVPGSLGLQGARGVPNARLTDRN
jgi:hypothetical protein